MVPERAMAGCCGRGGGDSVQRYGLSRRRKVVGCGGVCGYGRGWEDVLKIVVLATVMMMVSPVECKTNRSTLGK